MAVASATGALVGAAMISVVTFETVEALREVTRKIACGKP